MAPKPKVHIDKDGDGDIDQTVEVDVPEDDDNWPAGARDQIFAIIARMEAVLTPPNTRISYASAREALRSLLTNTP